MTNWNLANRSGRYKGTPEDFRKKYGYPEAPRSEERRMAAEVATKHRDPSKDHGPVNRPVRAWGIPLIWLAMVLQIGKITHSDTSWGPVKIQNINRRFYFELWKLKIPIAALTLWDVNYLLVAHEFGGADISWHGISYDRREGKQSTGIVTGYVKFTKTEETK